MTTEYRVRLDREACDGVFACLVRDPRFVEAEDGLATFEAEADSGPAERTPREVAATVADDRVGDAKAAAAACPLGAITVEGGDPDP